MLGKAEKSTTTGSFEFATADGGRFGEEMTYLTEPSGPYKKLLVLLKLEKLRANLSRQDGFDYSESEVAGWLTGAGFARVGNDGWWEVDEQNLRQLRAEEVSETRILLQ